MGCFGSKQSHSAKNDDNESLQNGKLEKSGDKEEGLRECRFCHQLFPENDYNSHTVYCGERIVTCWNSWCQKKIKQADLKEHMEECTKKRSAYCPRCGKAVLMVDLKHHLTTCIPVKCSHCSEMCIGRILKYCPVLLLGRFRLTVGPFATDVLRARFIPKDGTITETDKLNYSTARIQELFRWAKARTLIEDTMFRLIHKEMELEKESFAILNALNTSNTGSTTHKSKSVNATYQTTLPPSKGHYFPTEPGSPISADHIQQMIKELNNDVLLPYAAAWRIFSDALNHLNTMPNVVPVTSPTGARMVNNRLVQGGKIIVVGDLHGQLGDLLHLLEDSGNPGETVYYVFNGDFVDRGAHGVEVLLILFALIIAYPKYVYLNRGNHECEYMNEEYGFDVEATTKYDRNMYRLMQRCFCALPLATIIDNKIFVVHGGLSRRKSVKISEINSIQRFRQVPMPEKNQSQENEMYQDLLWSDPYDGRGWQVSERGAGVLFGCDITTDFLKSNNLELVIRSHEEFRKGYKEHHDNHLITVFSASNYDEMDGNNGAIVIFASNCTTPSFHTYNIKEGEQFTYEGEYPRVEGIDLYSSQASDMQGSFQYRVSNLKIWKRKMKGEVLRLIKERIYQRRYRIFSYFANIDKTQKGSVWINEWVEALRVETNMELPWVFLCRYLAEEKPTGRVMYGKFLAKFRNPISSLWLDLWNKNAIQRLISEHGAIMLLRKSFSDPLINYLDFCHAILDINHMLSETYLFQLFQVFDKEGKGLIVTKEFFKILEDASKNSNIRICFWDIDCMEQLQSIVSRARRQIPGIFRVSPKDAIITREKYMEGMLTINRGLRRPLTIEQKKQIFDFIAKGRNQTGVEDFINAFTIDEFPLST